MFDFFNMMFDQEQRRVAHFKKGELIVDTCAVTDSKQPYETGVQHPKYNNGLWVIVEMYNTKKQASAGHKRWVEIMTAKKLPEKIKDVSTASIALLNDVFDWRTRKKV